MNLTAEQLSAIIAQALVAASATAPTPATVNPDALHVKRPYRPTIPFSEAAINNLTPQAKAARYYFDGVEGVSVHRHLSVTTFDININGFGYMSYGSFPEVSLAEVVRVIKFLKKTTGRNAIDTVTDNVTTKHIRLSRINSHFKNRGNFDLSVIDPSEHGIYLDTKVPGLGLCISGLGKTWIYYAGSKGRHNICRKTNMSYADVSAIASLIDPSSAATIAKSIAFIMDKGVAK